MPVNQEKKRLLVGSAESLLMAANIVRREAMSEVACGLTRNEKALSNIADDIIVQVKFMLEKISMEEK